jgi:hypothetical protein
MHCKLAILYKPKNGNSVAVAFTVDPQLTAAVGAKAIQDLEIAAEVLGQSDPLMGEMQRLEAMHLRSILRTLMPELT